MSGSAFNWAVNDTLGGVGDYNLGSCPGSPSVVVNATQIPDWAWIAALVVAGLFFIKRR